MTKPDNTPRSTRPLAFALPLLLAGMLSADLSLADPAPMRAAPPPPGPMGEVSPHGKQPAESPHGALSESAPAAVDVTGIEKVEGGQTVGEIYDRRAELDGQDVVVRGKVVKFNGGIMKRNWLHLRDGSRGSNGENDLTVTTDGQAAVGDTVVVRGKLALNKDFGFSYRYDVLVEDASVTAE